LGLQKYKKNQIYTNITPEIVQISASMKTFIRLSILTTILVSIFACQENTTTSTQSAVAQITAFAFEANDSFPGLGEAVFIVEELTDTGLIRMRKNDSIRYGTPLDSVVPSITYYTTPSSVTFYLGDSAVSLTGYDTLNLAIKPIKIHVVAQNTDYSKWYKLEFDVHTMDGSLFHWDTLQLQIPGAATYGTQKAFLFQGIMYYYQHDGNTTSLFTSDDMGLSWEKHPVTGLPADCNVRQIVEGDEMIFYGNGTHFYYSSNGYEWDGFETNIEIVALYMCMETQNVYGEKEQRLWFAAKDENNCPRFCSIGKQLDLQVQIGIGLPGDSIPEDFPVEEYATIPFTSTGLHQHTMIAGGYDCHGQLSDARWSLEYNAIYNTYHITNMSDENKDFPPFMGSSISYYGNFLYLLGGIYGDNRSYFQNVYTSNDEGMHWVEVGDSTNYKRPENVKGRFHTNTFVDDDGNIYIIGGEDNSTTYSDVYKGRMNSIKWPEIGN